ncbi:group II intron reverse transcriptase/maturase [Alicyclobacillus acidoterrestris]|uniref:RNA-directed DNA polymerase n=1 Tax=Alicyclobacillus acidoterrestris (strain ATCC 49025 / DSM 3922 / CIP 106132 / NCIMB 13137 / GD3B) TaxID=1356854 RepID=A0A9E6ZWS2_ALIAG|nr:group II intron reverse transcriptase/maturase [Alicyclobacillus acidoterrestris]UNO50569.1 group II intron reverse transcriptase/maturase [Alicyclobacillus acidoterrestris]
MASSQGKQRQQKIPKRSYLQEEAVNPQGTEGVPSFSSARPRGTTREENPIDLMEQVVERENLLEALRRVERNKGAAGVDGMEIKSFRPFLMDNWSRIREELLRGTYKPMPVRRVEIPKPDGGIRMLGIPTVQDRLIQQALLQVLTPIFDPMFSTSSHGFRAGHSARMAVNQARNYVSEGYRWVVDMDLAQFFDRVNHDMLMARVARKVMDKRILRLIRRYLEAGILVNGVCVRSEEGTPQGGPMSPLLANILLDDLDKELERRGHRFVRYADDCNIYVSSRRAGERVMEGVRKYVEGRLKLKVNVEKSAVDRPWKRKFLGFSFTMEKRTRIRVAPKSLKRFKDRVRELTRRSRGQSMASRVEKLNAYLRGWAGYYRYAETRSVFEQLDEWTRRRLRMCLLKQWKQSKTKRRKLVSLGIPREWAVNISSSRKGHWRLSNTPQMNKALGLTYWREQGLVSLVERYDSLRSTT